MWDSYLTRKHNKNFKEWTRAAVILCSRKKSSRIFEKAFQTIGQKTLIDHLSGRLCKGIKTILAVPRIEYHDYKRVLQKTLDKNEDNLSLTFWNDAEAANPLRRMYFCALRHKIKHIIRVTHDKIYVDPDLINDALEKHIKNKHDYTFVTGVTEGIGFEIINFELLQHTFKKTVENVEHISYYVKKYAKSIQKYELPEEYVTGTRLLIDYPEDLILMAYLEKILGDAPVKEVIKYLNKNEQLGKVNQKPIITVYTCAFNAEKTINRCIDSVLNQSANIEYLIIDDASTDKTYENIVLKCAGNKRIKVVSNTKNLGLAACSNKALTNARGKYIVRLDADDYFIDENVLADMLLFNLWSDSDVIYPHNYFGSMEKIQKGDENNHVGGAIFKTGAINSIKFDSKLKHYDGLDLFLRAKELLKISYYKKPTFFYTQRPDSLSKTNPEIREKVKKKIEAKHGI